jgi:hypothetical protein
MSITVKHEQEYRFNLTEGILEMVGLGRHKNIVRSFHIENGHLVIRTKEDRIISPGVGPIDGPYSDLAEDRLQDVTDFVGLEQLEGATDK